MKTLSLIFSINSKFIAKEWLCLIKATVAGICVGYIIYLISYYQSHNAYCQDVMDYSAYHKWADHGFKPSDEPAWCKQFSDLGGTPEAPPFPIFSPPKCGSIIPFVTLAVVLITYFVRSLIWSIKTNRAH